MSAFCPSSDPTHRHDATTDTVRQTDRERRERERDQAPAAERLREIRGSTAGEHECPPFPFIYNQ